MSGGSLIVNMKIPAKNGDIRTVDTLMIPPAESVKSLLAAGDKFAVLNRAMEDKVLLDELRDLPSYTLFAPKDESFKSFSNLKIDERRLMRDHIVPGTFFSNIFTLGKKYELKALSGRKLSVQRLEDTMTVNGDVAVNQKDVRATNGIIHIVDKVIRL